MSLEAGLASSDHGMVRWNIYVGTERREGGRESLDYKRADFEGMRRELTGVDWGSLLRGSVEEDWISFRDLMCDLERRFIPVKRSGGPRKPMWMTYGARRAVINKRKVFAKHKDSAHPRCVEANKKADKEIRKAKFNYEKKLADNVKYDAKSFYAYVRSRSKSRPGIGVLTRDDGVRVESPEEVAEELNEYFSSVFSLEDMGSLPEGGGGRERWTCRIWWCHERRFGDCWEGSGRIRRLEWTGCPRGFCCTSLMRSWLRYACCLESL